MHESGGQYATRISFRATFTYVIQDFKNMWQNFGNDFIICRYEKQFIKVPEMHTF
jgi:hypothetical protein